MATSYDEREDLYGSMDEKTLSPSPETETLPTAEKNLTLGLYNDFNDYLVQLICLPKSNQRRIASHVASCNKLLLGFTNSYLIDFLDFKTDRAIRVQLARSIWNVDVFLQKRICSMKTRTVWKAFITKCSWLVSARGEGTIIDLMRSQRVTFIDTLSKLRKLMGVPLYTTIGLIDLLWIREAPGIPDRVLGIPITAEFSRTLSFVIESRDGIGKITSTQLAVVIFFVYDQAANFSVRSAFIKYVKKFCEDNPTFQKTWSSVIPTGLHLLAPSSKVSTSQGKSQTSKRRDRRPTPFSVGKKASDLGDGTTPYPSSCDSRHISSPSSRITVPT